MLAVAKASIAQRVVEIYDVLKDSGKVKNKAAFAAIAGFPQQYWTRFLSGIQSPSIEHANNIASHFGVSFTWLVKGEGPMFQPLTEKIPEVHAIGPLTDQPYVELPAPDFKTLAHFGQQPGLSLKSFADCPTLRVYLRPDEMPEKYVGAMVIQIFGDSMEPDLHDGQRMIVWHISESKWESLHNTVCVVSYDDTVTIKGVAENDLFVYDRLTLRAANPISSYFVVARSSISSIWEVREYYDRPKFSPSFIRR